MSQSHDPKHDLLDEAIEAFRRMSAPDRPRDADVRAWLDAELDGKCRPVTIATPARRSRHLRRFLAPSAAAAVVVVSLGLLWLWNGTAPLALADIVKAAQKYKLVSYKQQQITDAQSTAVLD